MIEIYNIEQGSEAWHELRAGRVTGTRFKELMAAPSTDTYKSLVNKIVGESLSGVQDDTYKNGIMEQGTEREPLAAKQYEFEYETQLNEVGFVINKEIHPEFAGVSPDRMDDDGNIYEIKCPLIHTHIKYLRDGKLPSEYKYQVQGQLLITGAYNCTFISYVPNLPLFVLDVYPDHELHKQMKDRLNDLVLEVLGILKELE
jgi:putative phage-type endonuclease